MKRSARIFLLTVILFLFWIVFTSSIILYELILGVIVCFITSLIAYYLLEEEYNSITLNSRQLFRLVLYIPYLIKEIIKANVDVAERVLRPDLPISPMIIPFRFPLKDSLSQITMANSITLTPGTLTVDIDEEGIFYIHCLADIHGEDLLKGGLRRHVINVYEGGKNV